MSTQDLDSIRGLWISGWRVYSGNNHPTLIPSSFVPHTYRHLGAGSQAQGRVTAKHGWWHTPWITPPPYKSTPGGIFVLFFYRHFITWGALETTPPHTKAHLVIIFSKVKTLSLGCAFILVILLYGSWLTSPSNYIIILYLRYEYYFAGGHSNQNPRLDLKNMYSRMFTQHIWFWLLCAPVIASRASWLTWPAQQIAGRESWLTAPPTE